MSRIKLTTADIHRAMHVQGGRPHYPFILTTEQAAEMLGCKRSTFYQWLQQGRFKGAYRKRGKGVRLLRDSVLHIFFNGSDW